MKASKWMAVAACVLTLAACGKPKDDGIASAGNGNSAKSSGAPIADDPQERMRQFAQCMRDNGIDMADPQVIEGEGGEVSVNIGPGTQAGEAKPGEVTGAQMQEDMEKFKKANEACKQYMPEGGPLGGKLDPEMEEKMREFAKCMREHGVENFPDPQEGGGIAIQIGPGSDGGLNPDDPTFKAAQEACGQNMPGFSTSTRTDS